MEYLLRQKRVFDLFGDGPSFPAWGALRKMRPAEPYEIIWWIFVASVAISIIPGFFGDISAPLSYVVAVGGAAGCGWGWLLARALFRAEKPIARWNIFALAAIVGVEAWWELTGSAAGGGASGEVRRIAANAASLICIGALSMVLVETLSGYSAQLPRAERRFRQTFAGVFSVIVAITLIWALNANEQSFGGQWADMVVAACAFIGVVGSRMAVSYRKRHPLAAPLKRKTSQTPALAAMDKALAHRIRLALEHEARFATPDLKVADLAAALGEQEYKVTQCITGTLGFRNFNHLINTRRIEHAKELLADSQQSSLPILSIAFDCGFNSIGPFNRAFKQEVGVTPRAYRLNADNQNKAAKSDEEPQLLAGE